MIARSIDRCCAGAAMTELRATYRLQLGRRLRLRARRASSCRTCATSASRTSTCRRRFQARAGLDARLRRRRPDARSPRSSAARRRSARCAAAHEAGLGDRARHRPQPHGDRRREPLLERPGAARAVLRHRPGDRPPPALLRHRRPRRRAPGGPGGVRRRRTAWRCALVREGVVDGLRDRPPRRARRPGRLPRAAARRRASSTCGSRRSSTPASSCATGRSTGTVGYEFLNDVGGAVRRPGGRGAADRAVGRAVRRRRGRSARSRSRPSSSRRRRRSRREVERLRRAGPDRDGRSPRRWPSLPVYRTYVEPWRGRVEDADREAIAAARLPATRRRAAARGARPRRVRHALPADDAAGDGQGRRGHRLLPLRAAARAQRGRRRPGALRHRRSSDFHAGQRASAPSASRATCSSPQTHDTKRSGDVRARIGALAGDGRRVGGARAALARRCRDADVAGAPDGGRAATSSSRRSRRLADRARAARGVPREGAARGQAQHDLGRARRGARGGGARRSRAACSTHEPFLRRLRAVRRARSRAAGDRAALGQLLLKLTVPGRARHLPGRRAALPLAGRPRQPPAGRLGRAPRGARRAGRRRAPTASRKLLVIRRALALRARRPEAFAGAYEPVDAGDDVVRVHARRRRGARRRAGPRARRARRSLPDELGRRVARRAHGRAARALAPHAGRRAHLARTAWRCSSACDDAAPKNASAVCG